jgi:hypothetical protein
MLKIALAAWLRLHNPTEPHYTVADFVADNPYTLRDYEDRPTLYTTNEFVHDLNKTATPSCTCKD